MPKGIQNRTLHNTVTVVCLDEQHLEVTTHSILLSMRRDHNRTAENLRRSWTFVIGTEPSRWWFWVYVVQMVLDLRSANVHFVRIFFQTHLRLVEKCVLFLSDVPFCTSGEMSYDLQSAHTRFCRFDCPSDVNSQLAETGPWLRLRAERWAAERWAEEVNLCSGHGNKNRIRRLWNRQYCFSFAVGRFPDVLQGLLFILSCLTLWVVFRL